MHTLKQVIAFCGLTLFTGSITDAQTGKPERYDFTPVYNKINGWVDSGYYKGASVIIVKNNQVVYEKYFGNYDTNTVAYIASAGKWMAAATIAAVVDEGKLSWNDQVKKWIPAFKDSKGEATLRQLLSHTAGYLDYQPAGKHPDNYQTLREAVANIVDLPADTLPGAKFKYGGLAMQVAGRMAELATGKSWEDIFQEKIARPLGMKLTHFTPVDATPGHNPMIGGGARSSLHDYARFLQMIVNHGVFNGKRILSSNAVNELQANQVRNARVGPGEFVERARASMRKDVYGLGEWREEVNEKGEATLISSPSWAGAYPWIDKKNNLYGFFLTRVAEMKEGFSAFYASPVLPILTRGVLNDAVHAVPRPAVWQWSVQVDSVTSGETNDHPAAFLWIPENCKQVRGVVVGQHNMIEAGIFEHPDFRKAMKEIGFAIVWVSPMLNMSFDFNKDAGEDFNYMMKKLADSSGYKELVFAPVIPVGHSAAATYPWNFAAWNPERTLAVISIHGDAPQTKLTGYGGPNVTWGNRNIEGVPGLMVMGEYEWWEDRIAPGFSYVNNHPKTPLTFFCDAGHGHFDYSNALVKYLALYIKKAAAYRLPAVMPLNKPATLKFIDPVSGWLMDRWRKDSLPKAIPAAYENYKGARYAASWCFDKELCTVTEKLYASARGKKQQYLGFRQNGEVIHPVKTHANYNLTFNPEKDGITFHVSAFFADTSRLVAVAEHAKTQLQINKITGPVKKLNDSTFQVAFDRVGFNNPKRSGDIWLIAENEGDATYKSIVQQADLHIPLFNGEGKEQQIVFAAVPDQKQGISSIPLNATSTAGLPVHFYVKEGPAEVAGSQLHFSKIPPHAKFPMRVTVVAWQYGIAGKVQSAKPVERTFYLIRG